MTLPNLMLFFFLHSIYYAGNHHTNWATIIPYYTSGSSTIGCHNNSLMHPSAIRVNGNNRCTIIFTLEINWLTNNHSPTIKA